LEVALAISALLKAIIALVKCKVIKSVVKSVAIVASVRIATASNKVQ
jgi:hypothetical protein